MSENGAFWGMLLGFLGGVVTKTAASIAKLTLPIYLDPFFVGIALSIVGVIAGSLAKKPQEEEMRQFEQMHVQPESEKNVAESRKTHSLAYLYIAFGVLLGVVFVFAYAIPYIQAV